MSKWSRPTMMTRTGVRNKLLSEYGMSELIEFRLHLKSKLEEHEKNWSSDDPDKNRRMANCISTLQRVDFLIADKSRKWRRKA